MGVIKWRRNWMKLNREATPYVKALGVVNDSLPLIAHYVASEPTLYII